MLHVGDSELTQSEHVASRECASVVAPEWELQLARLDRLLARLLDHLEVHLVPITMYEHVSHTDPRVVVPLLLVHFGTLHRLSLEAPSRPARAPPPTRS